MGGEGTILAIHPGALGDVVMLGHLLEMLGGEATLAAGGEKAQVLAGLGRARRAVDFDLLPMQEIFSERALAECTLTRRLGGPAEGFDRLVSFFPAEDSAAQMRLASLCQAGSAAFLPVRPGAGFGGHLLELWCDFLGLELDLGQYRAKAAAWAVPREWREQAQRELAKAGLAAGQEFMAIHPGSGGRQKCWPLERFVELGRRVREGAAGDRPRCEAVFVLGPAEMERWPAAAEGLTREFVTLRGANLATLAGVLATCRAYAGNDSGVSHLAAAVGARTVAIFGPTSPVHFCPLGPSVKVAAAGRMEEVEVEQVAELLQ